MRTDERDHTMPMRLGSLGSGNGMRTRIKAGVTHEDTNRDGGALAPVFEVAREFPNAGFRRISLGYTKTSQVPTYTALNSSPTAVVGSPPLRKANCSTAASPAKVPPSR